MQALDAIFLIHAIEELVMSEDSQTHGNPAGMDLNALAIKGVFSLVNARMIVLSLATLNRSLLDGGLQSLLNIY